MNKKEYAPVTYSEALHYADISKRMTREEVNFMQRVLLQRAFEAGVSSDEVTDIIYGMTARFVDEDNEMRRKAIEDDLRRRGVMQQEDILADDDQIVAAIKMTLPQFQSDWDWAGIYRILVDYCSKCGFKAQKTEFVRRFARMGIYPKDNAVKNIEHPIPPSIRATEWCDHQFSYEAIKKGVSSTWPPTYFAWQKSDLQNRDFLNRKDIATKFLNNLRIVVGTT